MFAMPAQTQKIGHNELGASARARILNCGAKCFQASLQISSIHLMTCNAVTLRSLHE
jgi:hypothetical protein